MHNTYLVLATTVTKQRTHIVRNPLELFIGLLPIILMIIGLIICFIIIIKSEYNSTKISEAFSEPDSISSKMLYNSLQQTKAYYKNNRIQMTIIFICAIISCFVGLTILMISIFYFNDEAKTMGIISGTVVSFISGTFFWIYKQCNNQATLF